MSGCKIRVRYFAAVGIQPRDITPWNAYPWYINRAPNATEREAGVEPLLRLMELMPRLQVVLLQGRDAQDCWRRALQHHPGIDDVGGLTVVPTYHPGRQALWARDSAARKARVRHRIEAYRRVAVALR